MPPPSSRAWIAGSSIETLVPARKQSLRLMKPKTTTRGICRPSLRHSKLGRAAKQTSWLGILKRLAAELDPACWKSAALSAASCLKDSYEDGTCSVWTPVMTSPHFDVGIGYPYSKERSRKRNFLRPHSTQWQSGTHSTSFRTLANCFTSCYR